MKFERTDSFKSDWQRLSDGERELFRMVIKRFHAAAERMATGVTQSWPAALRIRAVASAPGCGEMTWSFSGPDGRATFEWVEIEGARAIRWRRIGRHEVFRSP